MGLFSKLLFKMLPKVDGMVTYSNLLLMYDNLDSPLEETYTPEIKSFLKMLPLRINFIVVILCVQGEVRLKCNLKEYKLQPNGLIVLPSGTKAEAMDLADDSKVIVIVLPDQTYAPPASIHNSIYSMENFTAPFNIKLENTEVQSGIGVYRLLKAALQGDPDKVNADLVKSYMLLLGGIAAVGFQRWKLSNRKQKVSNKEQIYKDFLYQLSEEYREFRDVSHYAQNAGLTPKYFASVIYDASGHHPLDIIKEQVINDAKSLLQQGKSVGEVCDILHFSSQSQFTSYFKAAVGVPPREFMKIL